MSHTVTLKISGMTCQHCVKHTREALEKVAGVESAKVTLEAGQAVVKGSPDTGALIQAVKDAGYEASVLST